MRRDPALAAALAVVVLGATPAFSRLFTDDAWRGRYLAAAALALVVAALVRALRGGMVASALWSAAGLVIFTYVTALPHVGLLPGAASWGDFLELLGEAAIGLRYEVAPTAAVPPFTLAIATATWVLVHLAHELTVRWRRPGLGLVPLLVLWAFPLAIPLESGGADGTFLRALPFLAAAGLVLLLGTDHGVSDDEVRVTTSGLTVGAAALALATVTPLLLPGYGAEAWVDLGGGNDPRGYQPIVDVSERLQLPEERDVLRIRASERTYLRLAGLDSFDGATWRLGPAGVGSYQPAEASLHRADGFLPPEEEARSTVPTRVEVEVLELANIYVPAPYQPTGVEGDLTREMVWSTEGGFLATWNVTEAVDGIGGSPRVGVSEGVTYAVDAARPAPTLEDVREVTYDPQTLARWTQLPRTYDGLASAAEAVYAAADATTPPDKALALQDWFTSAGRFRYDLDVPALRGDAALEAFVLEDRVGYCEYFATAMAVMLRATGIPARVAVGFLPGTVTEPADPEADRPLTEFTVTTADAHAWVEVLFPGYGWVTFEPTPRSDQTQLVPTADDLAPVENLREQRARELEEMEADSESQPTPDTPDPVPAPQPTAEPDANADRAAPDDEASPTRWPWLVALLLAAGVVAASTTRRGPVPVGAPPAERVLAAQRALLATARRYGIGRAEHETTRELVRRWHAEGRVTSDGERFAGLAQAAAFGGDVDDPTAAEVDRLVAELESELRASVPPGDRLIAPVRVPLDATTAGVRRASGAVATRVRRRNG